MTKAQRSALARKNGRAGGLARAAAIRAAGSDQMRMNALKCHTRQQDIYGGLFMNRSGIRRLDEARRQARSNGGRAALAARRKKMKEAGNIQPSRRQEVLNRPPAIYKR
jgi:hypothetical protein